MMRKIDCCVCLDENVYHYTQEDIQSKCEHPVCKNCYYQLTNSECPLCRTEISSLLLNVKKAIYHVLNVRYDDLVEYEYFNLFFDFYVYEFVVVFNDYYYYEQKEFDYLHNKHIETDIQIEQKVCTQICN